MGSMTRKLRNVTRGDGPENTTILSRKRSAKMHARRRQDFERAGRKKEYVAGTRSLCGGYENVSSP